MIVVLIGVAVVLAGALYVIIYSPLAKITNIDITGTKTIDPNTIRNIAKEELSGRSYLVFPNDNMFVVNTDAIQTSILRAGLPLRAVTVRTSYKKITIAIDELQASMRVVGGAGSYILDQQGKVMKVATQGEGDNLIAITFSDPTKTFNIGDIVLSAGQMDFINKLHQYFATQAGIRDQIITIDEPNSALDVMTNEGWYAVFDPDIDLNEQLKSLSAVLATKFDPDTRKTLLYIDARFGDRVFYKTK